MERLSQQCKATPVMLSSSPHSFINNYRQAFQPIASPIQPCSKTDADAAGKILKGRICFKQSTTWHHPRNTYASSRGLTSVKPPDSSNFGPVTSALIAPCFTYTSQSLQHALSVEALQSKLSKISCWIALTTSVKDMSFS